MARRRRNTGVDLHGILLFDKPEGWTSADVVRRIKPQVRGKVGHLGTLDPFATGLLPICVGEGTKIAQFLNVAEECIVIGNLFRAVHFRAHHID